jgi:hypothetical protein
MKYPSPSDIEEMRARGYDISTIRDAEERSKLWHLAQDIIREICSAFEGVKLGNGVGLFEGQALDGYASPEVQAVARARDEMTDWNRLSVAHLNECSSSLSFFDAEGMRFHLPAFIIADIEGNFSQGLEFYLMDIDCANGRYALLSERQRAAVQRYIAFVNDEVMREAKFEVQYFNTTSNPLGKNSLA